MHADGIDVASEMNTGGQTQAVQSSSQSAALVAELEATSRLVHKQSLQQAELLNGLEQALAQLSEHRLLVQNPTGRPDQASAPDDSASAVQQPGIWLQKKACAHLFMYCSAQLLLLLDYVMAGTSAQVSKQMYVLPNNSIEVHHIKAAVVTKGSSAGQDHAVKYALRAKRKIVTTT